MSAFERYHTLWMASCIRHGHAALGVLNTIGTAEIGPNLPKVG